MIYQHLDLKFIAFLFIIDIFFTIIIFVFNIIQFNSLILLFIIEYYQYQFIISWLIFPFILIFIQINFID